MINVLNYIAYLILRFVLLGSKFLPMRPVFGIAWLMGNIGYYILPGLRRIALRNLDIAFGKEKSIKERKKIARLSFVNLCYSVAEFYFMERITVNWKKHFRFEGDQMIDECIRKKQAFFVFGGHLGGWMLIGMVPQRFGVSGGVVIRPQRNPYIDRYLRKLVAKHKGIMINTRKTGKLIEKLIMEGTLVGFYMDQESRRKQGIPVDFFGMPAYSHVVPGYLAWKHRIPMFPFWIIREKPGYMNVIFRPPLEFVYSGDKESDIRDVTQKIVKEVEATIREHPEQWLWAHNRWARTLGEKEERRKKKKKVIEEQPAMTSAEVVKMMDDEIGEQKDEYPAQGS